MNKILNIRDEFGPVTGLRHCKISEKSGEEFYHELFNSFFKSALDSNVKLEVVLDGIRGYSPSFIDESFGNLIYDFGEDLVKSNLVIISDSKPFWINNIKTETFPVWIERRKNNKKPIKTAEHEDWWRLNGKQLVLVNTND